MNINIYHDEERGYRIEVVFKKRALTDEERGAGFGEVVDFAAAEDVAEDEGEDEHHDLEEDSDAGHLLLLGRTRPLRNGRRYLQYIHRQSLLP